MRPKARQWCGQGKALRSPGRVGALHAIHRHRPPPRGPPPSPASVLPPGCATGSAGCALQARESAQPRPSANGNSSPPGRSQGHHARFTCHAATRCSGSNHLAPPTTLHSPRPHPARPPASLSGPPRRPPHWSPHFHRCPPRSIVLTATRERKNGSQVPASAAQDPLTPPVHSVRCQIPVLGLQSQYHPFPASSLPPPQTRQDCCPKQKRIQIWTTISFVPDCSKLLCRVSLSNTIKLKPHT